MIDKIHCEKRVGLDVHTQLIALLNAIRGGWKPPLHISEEEYNLVRTQRDKYPDYYVGLVGFCATFGAKYFGGYARGFKADKVTPRDVPNEAIRNLLKQAPALKDIKFLNISYDGYDYDKIKTPSVIYCDIPYSNSTGYSTAQFSHEAFWEWARAMSKKHYLLVSEYTAPNDFVEVWHKETTTSLKLHEHEHRTEKIFTYCNGLYANEYLK